MVVPFVAAFVAPVAVLNDRTQAQQAVADAKRAIGALTRLASDASNISDALFLHLCATQVETAALGAVGVAIDRADALCAKY